ncbi:P-loop containing nucleoside triphosphate hydrolase protein [Coniella lustricola]|uniref:P-loop containing nucleoside triphosphate hydrolase protein n=1 Tax=Coniella lustricola TaxID=2025994 RepID=A0A2T2ZX13_9PEZI|nr:P-loop containing nucleoside triphosphate hydrolase protein [Coniella lustricola]
MPPSQEQQVAIDTLLNTNDNLIVDACAGSGKTTTILHLAQSSPDTRFLVLVYNRRLMLETEERTQALGLANVTVMNYHTLGARCYTSECSTDQGLKRIVEDDMPVVGGAELPEFSVLVMDEQQDMTPIMKRFVDKLIRDKGFETSRTKSARRSSHQKKLSSSSSSSGRSLRVVVLGDRRQEVYGFNNADSRFLTMAGRPEVFGYINKHAWTSAEQTTSNRITQQNVDFINQQMLKRPLGEAMRAVRNTRAGGGAYPKPRYVICDPYEDLVDEVRRLLAMSGVSPTDIIVLAPSVRGVSPAIYLANSLALAGIPVFRSDSDVSDVAPEVARGKVLICTYHQAKGIERKASIVLGFDQGYHQWYNKVAQPPTATSNAQYVAATRALEHLVLIHDYHSPALPFVNLDTVGASCELVRKRDLDIQEPRPPRATPAYSVTALCRNVSETLITECLKRLRIGLVAAPAYGVFPPPETEIVDNAGLWEGVANVTGTAVPAIFQWRQRHRLTILDGPLKLLTPPKRKSPARRPNPLRQLPERFYEKIEQVKQRYDDGRVTTDDILYLSTLEIAAKDKDITKLLAIPHDGYTWLKEEHCRDIYFTLNTLPEPARLAGGGIFWESMRFKKFLDITHGGGPTNPEKREGVIVSGAMDMCRPGRAAAAAAAAADASTAAAKKPNKTVWEIKNSESLQPEHLLQVALYMLLLGGDASVLGFLVSSRTGMTVQVFARSESALMEILQLLVDSKSGGVQSRLLNTYTDAEFLDEARHDFAKLIGKCALPPWYAMRPEGSKYSKPQTQQGGVGHHGRKRRSKKAVEAPVEAAAAAAEAQAVAAEAAG